MERSHVRRGAAWMLTAFAVVMTGCGGDNGTGPGDDGRVATTSVTVTANQSFDPANIRVSPGATVTWTWAPSNEDHNIVFADASITDLTTGQSSGTFSTAMPTTPGTYSYLCQFHSGMAGSVLVE
ncbi:MAG TPA: plastocyanin/azurin family copper-binding protein [Longimicrobiales bacterium]|nr:plastocyanin/azurin family copper-binding protein [Longimicrobiales bacterium]